MVNALHTPTSVRGGVDWFFEAVVGDPTQDAGPAEGAAWCCALYAASAALAEVFGVNDDTLNELVWAGWQALAALPLDASPDDAVDATVSAARTALARAQLGHK